MTPSSGIAKATTIEELRKVCKPTPLEGEALARFFVETNAARDPHQEPRKRLRMGLDAANPARLLFYGHRGCGKSTELNKFLEENKNDFLPVKFSVFDTMTPNNVLAEDLMLVIAEQVLKTAQENRIQLDDASLGPVYRYFDEEMEKQAESHGAETKAAAGADSGASFLGKLLGVFVRISGEIQMNSYSEHTVVHALRKRPADLLRQVNAIIHAVRSKLSGKQLLIIVEDIDKLDLKQAREMYVNNVNLLTGLAAHVIYTIPIFLIHSPDLGAFKPRFDASIALPMIKVSEPGKAKPSSGHAIIKRIIEERVAKELFGKDALNLLIEKTGGVLRHAFEVLQIVATMTKTGPKITKANVRYGLNQLRKECLQQISLPTEPIPEGPKSVNELFDRLTEYAQKQLQGEKQEPVSDSVNQILLKTCALVEYNGEGWFGVHPLVMESLESLGRIALP